MADEEVTRSLLYDYSIAELQDGFASEQWGSLRDAFSRYAKVIFHDVADSYATDADILCCFTLASDMKHKEGDLVALFRLGWRHSNEMVTSQLVPRPSNPDSSDYEVLFRASDLPKNEGEIYQLCYISQNEVWGASVPFEFRRATAEELLVVDSGDIAIVRSQPAFAEDLKCQLAEMRKEMSSAESNHQEVREKLTQTEEQNRILEGRLKDVEKMEQVLDRLRADNQALDKSRQESAEALQKAQQHIVSLEKTIEALQQDLTRVKNQLSSSVEAYERQKVSQDQSCSQELIDALRQGKAIAVREMKLAMEDNEKLQGELVKVTAEVEAKQLQINELNEKLEKTEKDQENCETTLKNRIEELLAELTLLSSESHQSGTSYNQVEAMESKVAALESKLVEKEKELQVLKTQQKVAENSSQSKPSKIVTEAEIATLKKNLDDVTHRYSEVRDEVQSLLSEMSTLEETETSLLESHIRIKNRIECLEKMVVEADGFENDLELNLHRRELHVACAKLEEKSVCILSAKARKQELVYQLEELKQEATVLSQQEAEAQEALSAATNLHCNDGDASNQIVQEEQDSQKHTNHTNVGDGQIEREVAELRERLHQAAEAYKLLYQQKVQAERQLLRMQEHSKHSDEENKQ